MGTCANIYIKTRSKTLKYNVSMDGNYTALGVFIFKNLLYKKEQFLNIMSLNDGFDFDDKYQDVIYKINFDKSYVDIYKNSKNINFEVIDYLQKEEPDLVSVIHSTEPKISEMDYLEGELLSEIKHEYIDGVVYAMAGASENHNLISGNVFVELKNKLKQKKSSCKTFSSDMKARISENSTKFFYPDVMVHCKPGDNEGGYYKQSPVIIIEVLSKSTRKNDKTSKKLAYFNITTLQEYVIIEQDFCEVEVFRRSDHWKSTVYLLGDTITFESIDCTLSVEDIYYQVNNEDIVNYLKDKDAEKISE